MIFDDDTINLLKQLGGINNSVMLRAGKEQFSITEDQNVLGITELPVELPVDFGIFSMSQFLANLSFVTNSGKNADIELTDTLATIKGDMLQKYAACSPKAIKQVDPKKPQALAKLPAEISFELDVDKFTRLRKLAANNLSTHLFFGVDKNKVFLRAASGKDDSNGTVLTLDPKVTQKSIAERSVKIEHLNMVKDDKYKVSIVPTQSSGALKLESQTRPFTYYVLFAIEK